MRHKLLGGGLVAILLAACAAQEAKAPANSVTPSAPPGTAGAPHDQAIEPLSVARERAKNDLKQAEIALGQAGSDCSRACKALASMERATDHLCGVVSTPDEQKQCDEARDKLKSSKDRVRSTCGECTPP